MKELNIIVTSVTIGHLEKVIFYNMWHLFRKELIVNNVTIVQPINLLF